MDRVFELKRRNVLRQSFSGSEASTDVSSTENLSSCHRQEPQGEETKVQQSCLPYDLNNSTDSGYSILERLGMPASSIEFTSPNTPQIYVTGNTSSNLHGPHFATSPSPDLQGADLQSGQNFYMSSESGFSSASTSSSKLTLPDCNSSLNQTLAYTSSPISSKQTMPNFSSPSSISSYSNSTLYANYPTSWSHHGPLDTSQLHHQFSAAGHSGHMLPQYLSSLPPPPEYPGIHNQELLDRPEITRRSYEVIGKLNDVPGSRSQPDLTHFWDGHGRMGMLNRVGSGSDQGSQHSLEHGFPEQKFDLDRIAVQATQMVEVLTDENRSLREKLASYERKVSKLQKFELEIQKVYEGYDSLVKSSKKQELIEMMMKKKLEEELKNLRTVNTGLIRQLERNGIQVPDKVVLASTHPQDSSMAALLSKHKELLVLKERQDMELDAHKSTILEQRAQIDLLRSCQANCLRMEEENQQKQILADYDEAIQMELASIKAAYEKKEQTEKQIREKLEKEVEYCRRQHSLQGNMGKSMDNRQSMNAETKKMLEEKEAKILQLEKELIMWKEQHLEESIRKLKLQDSDMDIVSRLPPYEQAAASLNPTETLINEAKAEKLKQMEEIYQANRNVTELEATVKSLQSQLAEKESMLRVYQRSPMTRSSSVHSIYCTPHHSPRPSLIATGSLSRQSSSDAALLLEIRHKKTGSTSALELASRQSQDDLFEKIQGLRSEVRGEQFI